MTREVMQPVFWWDGDTIGLQDCLDYKRTDVYKYPLYREPQVAQPVQPASAQADVPLIDEGNKPEQEPVVTKNEKGLTLHVGWDDLPAGTKLYTSPPQREWVGLTADELDYIADDHATLQGASRAIEAKLKERNK